MKKIIVKKDYVTEVTSVFSYMIEKLNLNSYIETLQGLIQLLLSNIKTYPQVQLVLELLNSFIQRFELFKKFSLV
ncbi:MAG: hypothetical protein N4A33_02020 [Bacteriovoracaceae bacterium]|jgi:hypothetical protein|nr:hypothetical protein [Bacteriovoracaceae bacterium]